MPARQITEYYRKRKATSAMAAKSYKRRKAVVKPTPRLTTTGRLNFSTKNLKYTEQIEINAPSASSVVSYRFRANSVYDPNKTGGGHQPMGHAEMQHRYDRYIVNGSRIMIELTWTSSSGGGPLIFALGLLSSSNTWGSIQNAAENGAHTKVMVPYTGPTQSCKIAATYSAKSQYGVIGADLRNNQNAIALTTTNPINIEDFVLLASAGSVAPSANLIMLVHIDYNITYFDVKRDMGEDT